MPLGSLKSSSTMSSNTLAFIIHSSLIKVLSSLLSLQENWLIFWNMTFDCPLPITPKLMVKLNEPIRNLRLIFVSFVPITPHHGHNSSLLPNSTIILPPIALPRNLHFPSSMTMNLAPTPPQKDLPSCPWNSTFCPWWSLKRSPDCPWICQKTHVIQIYSLICPVESRR